MLPVYLEPNEDEYLTGWFVNLASVNGVPLRTFLKYYLQGQIRMPGYKMSGKQTTDTVNLITSYAYFQRSHPYLPDEKTILQKHTLIPAIAPFITDGQLERAVHLILYNSGRSTDATLYPTISYMRICPDCLRSDISANRIPYYRTWHQLPCVRVCCIHGCRLLEKKDLSYIGADDNQICQPLQMSYAADTELRIARFIFDLFQQPVNLNKPTILLSLPQRLKELGYTMNTFDKLTEDLLSSPFKQYFQRVTTSVYACLFGPSGSFESTVILYLYLFGNAHGLHSWANRRCNVVPTPALTEKRCDCCGRMYLGAPVYLSRMGCPFCNLHRPDADLISERLQYCGDGNYIMVPGDKDCAAQIMHTTCGKLMRYKRSYIWGKRCSCEARFRSHTVSNT